MNASAKVADTRPLRLCLSGCALDTGNMGVSALAVSLVGLICTTRGFDTTLSLLVGGRSGEPQILSVCGRDIVLETVNYRLSPRAHLHEHLAWILFLAVLYRVVPVPLLRRLITKRNRWLRAVSHADFVGDINGGDSFSDIYGGRKFFLNALPALITLLIGRDLVLLPQTYGPYTSRLAWLAARFILKRARCVMSRDRASLGTVSKMRGNDMDSRSIRFCPDVAFMLEGRLPLNARIDPPLPESGDSGIIGLNVNGLLYHGGYNKRNMFSLIAPYNTLVQKLAFRLIEMTGGHLLLVPHTFAPHGDVDSDPDACELLFGQLKAQFPERVHLVRGCYDQSEIKGLIGRCDFFVGSRLHACIAALSQAVPTVGIAYSGKFAGVFGSLGMGEAVIDAREHDVEAVIDQIMRHYQARERDSERLRAKLAEVQQLIRKEFALLLDRWN